ncbi:MAG: protein kinase domain-containing protein [Polyangia bacterium]
MSPSLSADMKRNNQISAGTLVGGRFQIQCFLGEEGGSELYQAQDSQGGAAVALRVFSATEMTRTVVETDLGKAAQVSHKNLATLVAWGLEGDRIYVATEATDGPSLRQILDAKRREGSVIGLTHAHVLLGHVGNALDRVHSTLVHGGVNPSAIRVTSAGRVKLTDLGLSRALPALARRGGADFNSQGVYLAPEVAAGEELSPSADVYSLAAILYEMLTGHAPASPLWPPSQVNSAVPPAVDAVVARGMAPLSETRFSRPKELLDALGAVLASMAGGVQPAAVQPKAPSARLSMGKSFSVADAVRLTEEYERWLIQKDKLDYGPFSLAQVMAQMEKGIFNGDDIIVDVDSGDRQKIRENPQLVEFTRLTERRLEAQRRAQAEQAHEHVERKKGRWTIFIIGSAVVALAAGLAWFIHQRVAAKDDVLASRVSEADVDAFLKDVKISFPEHRRAGGARHGGPGGGVAGRAEDFNNSMDLGDVTQGGGDAILDEGTIDRVMHANYRRLVPCIMGKGVPTIEVDFVVQPTGRVKAVRVNGQGKGPLPMCILNQMQSFGFPAYKGKNTIANWSMSIR